MKYLLILILVLLLGGCTVAPVRETETKLEESIAVIKPDSCLLRIDNGVFYITDNNNRLLYKTIQGGSEYITIHIALFIFCMVIVIGCFVVLLSIVFTK